MAVKRRIKASKKNNKQLELIAEFEAAKQQGWISSYEVPALDKKSCGRFVVYKPVVDDIVFDSAMEAEYYIYLKSQKYTFDRQVVFELQPAYKLSGKKIAKIEYIADFVIYDENHTILHVIDVKGRETPEFRIKKKLFEFRYQIPLECIAKYHNTWMNLSDIRKAKRKTKKR